MVTMMSDYDPWDFDMYDDEDEEEEICITCSGQLTTTTTKRTVEGFGACSSECLGAWEDAVYPD